jgi:hypothetical protein
MVETTTISTITQPTVSSTIFSIKSKQDEDNSISVGIQFKNEESVLLNNKSHTHNAKKKKHWHHHKEEHRQGNTNLYLPFQIGTLNSFPFLQKTRKHFTDARSTAEPRENIKIDCQQQSATVFKCHRRSFNFNLVFPFFNLFFNSFLHQFAECIILDKSNYTKIVVFNFLLHI